MDRADALSLPANAQGATIRSGMTVGAGVRCATRRRRSRTERGTGTALAADEQDGICCLLGRAPLSSVTPWRQGDFTTQAGPLACIAASWCAASAGVMVPAATAASKKGFKVA